MAKGVTKRQEQFVSFIVSFIKKNDYSPTLEEIAKQMGITPPAVLKAIRSLEKKGVLTYTPSIARSIKVVDMTNLHVKLVAVPLFSEEPSVNDILNNNYSEEYFVSSLEAEDGEYLAFRINNPTMNTIGIYKGDIALVKKTNKYESNNIVLVVPTADDPSVKSSLRRYYYNSETSCRLDSENENQGSITTSNYVIIGVLKSIKREIS